MAHWRYDAQPLLRYATMPEAPLYHEIMEIFAEGAAGYASRLSPEDVHAALLARLHPGTGEPAEDMPGIAEVKERLGQLWRWGNQSQDFDTAWPYVMGAVPGRTPSLRCRDGAVFDEPRIAGPVRASKHGANMGTKRAHKK